MKFNKKIFFDINNIAVPLIISSISSIIMGIIDQAFIGRISIESYAGVGLVLSCINSLIGVLGAIYVFSYKLSFTICYFICWKNFI